MEIEKWIELAIATAHQSPARPRKVGAVLILVDGHSITACNDFPRGVRNIESRHGDTERLLWIEHAERNAIFAAAHVGRSTARATLVTTFHPCVDCARAVVQAGIADLHTLEPDFADPVWGQTFGCARDILKEGGVSVNFIDRDPAEMHMATLGLDRRS